MSIVTTADEQLAQVHYSLTDAITALSDIVVNRVWGWDDFNDDFKKTLIDEYTALLAVRARLDP